LADRIAYIDQHAASDCPLEVTAALALLEGVVLYSAFGFFKGFNSRGFNLIPHFVSGIDASAIDEDFHSRASAFLFNQCLAERKELGHITPSQEQELHDKIVKMAELLYQHELRIIDLMFEKGEMRVVNKEELIDFVRDRVDVVLRRLN